LANNGRGLWSIRGPNKGSSLVSWSLRTRIPWAVPIGGRRGLMASGRPRRRTPSQCGCAHHLWVRDHSWGGQRSRMSLQQEPGFPPDRQRLQQLTGSSLPRTLAHGHTAILIAHPYGRCEHRVSVLCTLLATWSLSPLRVTTFPGLWRGSWIASRLTGRDPTVVAYRGRPPYPSTFILAPFPGAGFYRQLANDDQR
jgi:hypothetical protein